MSIGTELCGKAGVFLLVVITATAGFPTTVCAKIPSPQAIGYAPLAVPNSCLPDAAGFRNAFQIYRKARGYSAWTRLLLVYSREHGHGERAHAYCVFTLEGRIWAYDQVAGSQRVWITPAEKNNAAKLGGILAAGGFVRASWVDRAF